jgi:hypothetical protein
MREHTCTERHMSLLVCHDLWLVTSGYCMQCMQKHSVGPVKHALGAL